jgi:hypothetical protein
LPRIQTDTEAGASFEKKGKYRAIDRGIKIAE